MARIFSSEDYQNIRNMLQDPDAGGDIVFWLYATVAYAVLRVTTDIAFPGKIRGFTPQQYVVSLLHQGVVLPVCVALWILGTPAAPEMIYLLTGAYLASDSIMNYTPVSGCVAGTINVAARRQRVTPDFSWGIHAHHLFTVLLCALGTNLPASLTLEGAVCILFGEAGSLWISVCLLRPSPLNFTIRYAAPSPAAACRRRRRPQRRPRGSSNAPEARCRRGRPLPGPLAGTTSSW